jgi:formate-dependent nitrite reductase cytochrome c552 subunit
MDAADIELRNATYGRFVELGRAPTPAEVAEGTTRSEEDVREGWRRLHEAHALVLDEAGHIRMANPFSAVRTPFRVHAAGKDWFANCGWDAFGIGAALRVDSVIETECADCHEPITLHVRDGRPDDIDLLFHVPIPAIDWWRDIGFT